MVLKLQRASGAISDPVADQPGLQIPLSEKAVWARRAFPRPSEGYSKWASLQPEVNSAAAYDTVLSEAHAAGADVGILNAYVAKVLRYTGTTRFLNKNTRNALRIPCLRAVFPDAYFIHVLRDGRAVANSLLKMSRWPEVRLWSAGERRAPDLERNGIDPVLDPRPALDENDLEGT